MKAQLFLISAFIFNVFVSIFPGADEIDHSDFDENHAVSAFNINADLLSREIVAGLESNSLQELREVSIGDFDAEANLQNTTFTFANSTSDPLAFEPGIQHVLAKIGYWQTVYSIESKQGKLLYRPRNKARNCTWTTAPCGHHQLTVQALRDIGCKSLQCRKDRLNYKKSLEMSKKLQALNLKRLKKHRKIEELTDYQKYLIHQQGASGIKTILAATQGKKNLSRRMMRNMANNSPYSYRKLKRMGSKLAAQKFLQHWEQKWQQEKMLVAGIKPDDIKNIGKSLTSNSLTIAAADTSNKTESEIIANSIDAADEDIIIPVFSENEIQLALNYRF